ncbi:MAG: TraB/GumN family protein [Sandaracinaceae bacterium]|nr:TraB/GumN family protein [Sandaracinaceae bacterium]
MRSLSPVLRATSVTLTLLPALLALAGCGGTAATAEPSTVLSAPAHAPFLWRVTSPEGQVSHLMGTIHGAVTLEEALPAPHNGLLSTAEAVYVESLVDDQAQLMAFAQRMLQPSEVPLSQKVGAQTFDALVAQLATFPRERLDTLRPWAAFFVVLSVRLTQSLQAHAREAGTDPATPAMDAVILQQTRARELTPQPLEQMNELADIFEGLDEAVYLAMLAEFAEPVSPDATDPAAEQLSQLVTAYRAGDLEAMTTLVDQLNTGESTSAFFTMLIAQRNALWMTRLRSAFNAGGAFVAVGAAHLPGPEGLLAQLTAVGFVVTRL